MFTDEVTKSQTIEKNSVQTESAFVPLTTLAGPQTSSQDLPETSGTPNIRRAGICEFNHCCSDARIRRMSMNP